MEIQEQIRKNMKDVGAVEVTRIVITAPKTPENEAVHKGFLEFCRIECGNDYTVGLRQLLTAYESDYRMELLYDKIRGLEEQVDMLKQAVSKPKKEESDTF